MYVHIIMQNIYIFTYTKLKDSMYFILHEVSVRSKRLCISLKCFFST